MSEANSYRQILRSSSIIGGASVINVLISLIRTKTVAVLLGPAGVGLLGLLQNLMESAATVSLLGFGKVGARQIAEATGRADASGVAAARRAFFWGTLVLATLGVLVFWLLRATLAEKVLGNVDYADDVGWLAIGVGLLVASTSQGGLLIGLRRIGDLARVSVWSSALGTLLGVGCLWLWGQKGLILFLLTVPLSNFLVGHLLVARLPAVEAPRSSISDLMRQWQTLLRLGFAFMVSGLAVTAGQLVVRSMVQHQLGADALGQFQAAWAISMTYVGFVLTAMGSDYYPRLTAAIHDHAAVNKMVNEQTEVALLIAGPIFLTMLALAPEIVVLLYSHKFHEAANVLRWQVLGDILKLAGWPMGYMILAAGEARTFMLTESLTIGVFTVLVWLGLPLFGVQVTGLAFIGMYLVYLPLVYWLAWRKTKFQWASSVRRILAVLLVSALLICLLRGYSATVSAIVGVAMAFAFGVYASTRLAHMSSLGGFLGKLAMSTKSAMEKVGLWHE